MSAEVAPDATAARAFAAHWTSPHGGVRVFLGVGSNPDEARRAAQHELVRRGFGNAADDGIEVVPAAWAPRRSGRVERPHAA
jgi:hypothetical protein